MPRFLVCSHSMTTESDRCARWRKIAIEQLGYALNLVLTLTIAALGYWFALLKDAGFVPGSTTKCAMLLALCLLALAAASELACIVNRLWDFRGTASRACENPDAPTQDELRGLGRFTWFLFYLTLGSFAAGIFALSMALFLTYGSKLR